MVKEGYLIKYNLEKETAEPLYCVLDHGKMRFFNRPGGLWLDEVELTGSKSKVKALSETSLLKNAFQLDVSPIIRDSKSHPIRLGEKRILVFGAPNKQIRNEWGLALLTWQRYYFKTSSDMKRRPDDLEVRHQFNMIRQTIQDAHIKTTISPTSLRPANTLYRPRAFTFSLPPSPVSFSPSTPQVPEEESVFGITQLPTITSQ